MTDTTDLAKLDPESNVMDLGRIMAASGFFADARQAGQAVVKILAGRELGVPPLAAMTGIHVIKGRMTLSANLMGALVKKSGKYNYRVMEHDTTHCTIEFMEKYDDGSWQVAGVSSFSMEDAKQAGLGGDNWKNYPRNMLLARALSNGVKWYCPDVFNEPVYTPDEIEPAVVLDEEGEVKALPAEGESSAPVEPPPAEPVEETGELLTDAQRKHLMALAGDLGVKDALRKKLAAADLELDSLASFNDLTKAQAHALIEIWMARVASLADAEDVSAAESRSSGDDSSPGDPAVPDAADEGSEPGATPADPPDDSRGSAADTPPDPDVEDLIAQLDAEAGNRSKWLPKYKRMFKKAPLIENMTGAELGQLLKEI